MPCACHPPADEHLEGAASTHAAEVPGRRIGAPMLDLAALFDSLYLVHATNSQPHRSLCPCPGQLGRAAISLSLAPFGVVKALYPPGPSGSVLGPRPGVGPTSRSNPFQTANSTDDLIGLQMFDVPALVGGWDSSRGLFECRMCWGAGCVG